MKPNKELSFSPWTVRLSWRLLARLIFFLFFFFFFFLGFGKSNTKSLRMEGGVNPYQVLGVAPEATDEEIRKAYRQVARQHHPDKTAGQPTEAASRLIFEQAKSAVELLSDPQARAAYDKVLQLQEAARRRNAQRDAAQRQARSKLEEREDAARKAQREQEEAQRQLQAQIVRLRAENEARLQAERERLRTEAQAHQRAAAAAAAAAAVPSSFELKIRWQPGPSQGQDYSEAELTRLFAKYGPVRVIMSRKPGRALVSFDQREAAQLALDCERGRAACPLTKVAWADEEAAAAVSAAAAAAAPTPGVRVEPSVVASSKGPGSQLAAEADERVLEATTLSDAGFEAYEAAVLGKLRRTQRERNHLQNGRATASARVAGSDQVRDGSGQPDADHSGHHADHDRSTGRSHGDSFSSFDPQNLKAVGVDEDR